MGEGPWGCIRKTKERCSLLDLYGCVSRLTVCLSVLSVLLQLELHPLPSWSYTVVSFSLTSRCFLFLPALTAHRFPRFSHSLDAEIKPRVFLMVFVVSITKLCAGELIEDLGSGSAGWSLPMIPPCNLRHTACSGY